MSSEVIGFRDASQSRISFVANSIGADFIEIHKNNSDSIQLVSLNVLNNTTDHTSNLSYDLDFRIKIDNPTVLSSVRLYNRVDKLTASHSSINPFLDIVRLQPAIFSSDSMDFYYPYRSKKDIEIGDVIKYNITDGIESMRIQYKAFLPFQFTKLTDNSLFEFSTNIYTDNDMIEESKVQTVFDNTCYNDIKTIEDRLENENNGFLLLDPLLDFDEMNYNFDINNPVTDFDIPYIASRIVSFKSQGSILINFHQSVLDYWKNKIGFPVSFKYRNGKKLYPQAYKLQTVTKVDEDGTTSGAKTQDHIMLIFEVENIGGVNHYKNYQYQYQEDSVLKYRQFLPNLTSVELQPLDYFATKSWDLVCWLDNENATTYEMPLYSTYNMRFGQITEFPLRADILNTNVNDYFTETGEFYQACVPSQSFFYNSKFEPFIEIQKHMSINTQVIRAYVERDQPEQAPVQMESIIPSANILIDRGSLSFDEYSLNLGLLPYENQIKIKIRKTFNNEPFTATTNLDSYTNLRNQVAYPNNYFCQLSFDLYFAVRRNYDLVTMTNTQPTTDINLNTEFELYQAESSLFYKLNVRNNRKIRGIQNLSLNPGTGIGVMNTDRVENNTYFEGSVIQF